MEMIFRDRNHGCVAYVLPGKHKINYSGKPLVRLFFAISGRVYEAMPSTGDMVPVLEALRQGETGDDKGPDHLVSDDKALLKVVKHEHKKAIYGPELPFAMPHVQPPKEMETLLCLE